MPDRPKPAPQSALESRKGPPESEPAPDGATPHSGTNRQTDLATLAARFTAHSGGKFTPEFSAELALDIVLNELAEQACLATGATGAAIFLARDGELVCRASSGTTAPELGARLEEGSGISQACVASGRIQKCDDAQSDPRADTEASRSLDIRSLIVLPLLRNREVAGLFEAFSTRPAAFPERDQRTLETLARRVVQNLERAERPFPVPLPPVPSVLPSLTQAGCEAAHRADDPFLQEDRLTQAFGGLPSAKETDGRGLQLFTWALSIVVLGCAVLMGALVIQRLGWLRPWHPSGTAMREDSASAEPGASAPSSSTGAAPDRSTFPAAPIAELKRGELNRDGLNQDKAASEASQPGSGRESPTDPLQPGTLRIYKNGREVFRVPSATAPAESGDTPGVQRASSIEPADKGEWSSAAAEDGLVQRVEPEYPEEARLQNIQGAVVLEVQIDQTGVVQAVRLISGPDILANAAIDAVKHWRFKARSADTRPAETQTRITLNFKLPNK